MREKKAERTESTAKEKLLQTAIQEIEKSYGKGAIMRLGESIPKEAVPAISTGALPLDLALGVGGLPRGRIVEIFGPESGGKTTLALHVVAEAQRTGGTCAFIDAEHALDPAYAACIGVDVDELLISQPDTGEQGLQIADSLVHTGAVDVIVVDSVAALVPAAELEGRMGDVHVGLQARLMSQALRKLTHTVSKSKSVIIFINQLRERIGNLPPGFRGELTTTPGGRALKFYASVRIDIRPIERIKQTIGGEDRVIGRRVVAKVVKNKCAPPFREARFEIVFGQGVSREGCLIDMGLESGVIEKSGAFFAFGEERLGQGREAVRGHLKENPRVAAAIEKALTERIRSAP